MQYLRRAMCSNGNVFGNARGLVQAGLYHFFLEERRKAQNTSRFLIAFSILMATWIVSLDDHG